MKKHGRRFVLWMVIALVAVPLLSATGRGATIEPSEAYAVPASAGLLWGVLGDDPARLKIEWEQGVRLKVFELFWDRYEPGDGAFDPSFVDAKRSELAALHAQGFKVILDLGLQYPPDWLFSNYPNARYVNQYGDAYAGMGGQGGVNFVFNLQMRQLAERYVGQAFADFGTDFYAVRLGWGYFGELNYPAPDYNGHGNSYWAFDANALAASPLPDWAPGTPSSHHQDAGAFIDWYLNRLVDCQQWQIATVRRHYTGQLAILYPSWGVRPGQIAEAVKADLNGSTTVEINGELQRGFDFARLVAAASTDRKVIVYCTWMEADAGMDATDNAKMWSPAKYLASLARQYGLSALGETAASNSLGYLHVAAMHARQEGMLGLIWGFESELYDTHSAAALQRLMAEAENRG